jgi:hypothetical protein
VLAVLFLAGVGICTAQDMFRVVRGGWRREEAAAPATIPRFEDSITWYRFNEFTNAQGKHVDSSAVGTNTAVPAAGGAMPTWVSASQGIYLNGDDYSSQDVGYILNGLTGLTYSVWVSNSAWSTEDGIFFARGASRYGIGVYTATNVGVAWMEGTRSFRAFQVNPSFDSAGWTHIAATWVGNSNVQTYINGVLDTTGIPTTATNLVISGQNDVLRIGFDDALADRKWMGNIDDLLIYKVALSSNEVFQLYQFGH